MSSKLYNISLLAESEFIAYIFNMHKSLCEYNIHCSDIEINEELGMKLPPPNTQYYTQVSAGSEGRDHCMLHYVFMY